MKLDFFKRPVSEQAVFIRETAARRGLLAVMVEKPLRDRFSRHYSDMAALARHAVAEQALARGELRQRVANWKSRFFAASWARYDLATPGTFRLAPPKFRLAEVEKDYRAMQPMFLAEPPSFANIIEVVPALENRINQKA